MKYNQQVEKTDSELMEAFRAGDRRAFDALVDRYADRTYSFALRLSGDAAIADDAAQEAFIKVWKNRNRFKSGRAFRPWLFAIARNATLDIMRRRRDYAFSKMSGDEDGPTFEEGLADDSVELAEGFDRAVLAGALEETLKDLTPDQRAAVVLHDIEGLTFEAAGKTLRKPMNTVKSNYRRAIQSLRRMLQKRGY